MDNKLENVIDQLTELKLEIVDSGEWVWGDPEVDRKWIHVLEKAIEMLEDY